MDNLADKLIKSDQKYCKIWKQYKFWSGFLKEYDKSIQNALLNQNEKNRRKKSMWWVVPTYYLLPIVSRIDLTVDLGFDVPLLLSRLIELALQRRWFGSTTTTAFNST